MEHTLEIIEPEKRALLRRMSRVGLPDCQIAFTIGIGIETLQTFYDDLLQEAKIGVNLHILETLEHLARSGKSVSATIFWARSQGGLTIPTAGGKQQGFEAAMPVQHRTFIVTGPNGERK